MSNYAKLVGKKVVEVDDLSELAGVYQSIDNRRVAFTKFGEIEISTVFLGINHGYFGEPQWFETMVFGGPLDQHQDRYATYEEAEAGHALMVARVKAAT